MFMKLRSSTIVVLLGITACVKPPAPALRSQGTVVNSNFEKSWLAAVATFEEKGIQIRTMDHASGYLSASGIPVKDSKAPAGVYDCGKNALGVKEPATVATYNVLVRAQAPNSTLVKA